MKLIISDLSEERNTANEFLVFESILNYYNQGFYPQTLKM